MLEGTPHGGETAGRSVYMPLRMIDPKTIGPLDGCSYRYLRSAKPRETHDDGGGGSTR